MRRSERLAALALTGSLLLHACTAGSPTDLAAEPDPGLESASSISYALLEPPPVAMTIRIANLDDRPLVVETLNPVTQEGLAVEFVGWTYCERGCPGTRLIDEPSDRASVQRQTEGRLPFEVPPTGPDEPFVSLIFIADLTEAGHELVERSCLRMTALELGLDDGSTQEITSGTGQDQWLLGLQSPDTSGDYVECGVSMGS